MQRVEDFYTYPTGESDTLLLNQDAGLIATDSGNTVDTYPELLKKVANLNYHNPGMQLTFRGQGADYRVREGGHSSLYPSIFRPSNSESAPPLIRSRYEKLNKASDQILEYFRAQARSESKSEDGIWSTEYNRVRMKVMKNTLLRWAIIQHYEICDTPLLDVTGDLETAIAFAFMTSVDDVYRSSGYIFVVALPPQFDTISVSSNDNIISIRLAQFFPPTFLRPHYQKGILAGEYPEVIHYDTQHSEETRSGYNFTQRLVAKFFIRDYERFASSGYSMISESILKPTIGDDFAQIAKEIRESLAN